MKKYQIVSVAGIVVTLGLFQNCGGTEFSASSGSAYSSEFLGEGDPQRILIDTSLNQNVFQGGPQRGSKILDQDEKQKVTMQDALGQEGEPLTIEIIGDGGRIEISSIDSKMRQNEYEVYGNEIFIKNLNLNNAGAFEVGLRDGGLVKVHLAVIPKLDVRIERQIIDLKEGDEARIEANLKIPNVKASLWSRYEDPVQQVLDVKWMKGDVEVDEDKISNRFDNSSKSKIVGSSVLKLENLDTADEGSYELEVSVQIGDFVQRVKRPVVLNVQAEIERIATNPGTSPSNNPPMNTGSGSGQVTMCNLSLLDSSRGNQLVEEGGQRGQIFSASARVMNVGKISNGNSNYTLQITLQKRSMVCRDNGWTQLSNTISQQTYRQQSLYTVHRLSEGNQSMIKNELQAVLWSELVRSFRNNVNTVVVPQNQFSLSVQFPGATAAPTASAPSNSCQSSTYKEYEWDGPYEQLCRNGQMGTVSYEKWRNVTVDCNGNKTYSRWLLVMGAEAVARKSRVTSPANCLN